jgi:hypothetical protein
MNHPTMPYAARVKPREETRNQRGRAPDTHQAAPARMTRMAFNITTGIPTQNK